MIHALLGVPLLVKIVVSLFVILGANRLTGRLWAAVLSGIAVFALWTPRAPSEVFTAFRMRVSSADDLFFILILFLVVWMSAQMSAAGTMKRIVTAAEALLPRRPALAAVPMLIGFLPMPGGALFSAPLVEALDRGNTLDADLKARINYWFRHIWEYWWPLYPGALLAAEIFKLPPHLFMMIQIPLSLLAVFSGWLFLLRRVPKAEALGENGGQLRRDIRAAALQGVAPILVLTLSYALVSFLLPSFARISKYLPMVCGVVAAMVYLQWRNALPAAAWKKILFSRSAAGIAFAVWLVRVYGALAELPFPDGTLPMHVMQGELAAWGLPAISLVMVLPFIAGVTSGVAVGFVGASFPFIAALLAPGAPLHERCALEVLAYGFGYMGLILSPIHACLIVSCDHFKTPVAQALLKLLPATTVVMVGTLLWYAALKWGLIF